MSYTSTHSVVERKVAEKNSAEISEQYPTGSHTLPGAALRRPRVTSWPRGVKDAALELGITRHGPYIFGEQKWRPRTKSKLAHPT